MKNQIQIAQRALLALILLVIVGGLVGGCFFRGHDDERGHGDFHDHDDHHEEHHDDDHH